MFLPLYKDLHQNAQMLSSAAQIPKTTNVKIIYHLKTTLTDHAVGVPGRAEPLQLTAATIQKLITDVPILKKQNNPNPPIICTPQSNNYLSPRPPFSSSTVYDFFLFSFPLSQPRYPLLYAVLRLPL